MSDAPSRDRTERRRSTTLDRTLRDRRARPRRSTSWSTTLAERGRVPGPARRPAAQGPPRARPAADPVGIARRARRADPDRSTRSDTSRRSATVGTKLLDAGDIARRLGLLPGDRRDRAGRRGDRRLSSRPRTTSGSAQIIEVAFNQGVHPRKGFELILDHYGTCSAITAFEHLPPDEATRVACADRLVRQLHEHLVANLRADIAQRGQPLPPEGTSIAEPDRRPRLALRRRRLPHRHLAPGLDRPDLAPADRPRRRSPWPST